jgi:hypothetical protein
MHMSRMRHRFTAVLGALIVLSLLVVPAAIPAIASHSNSEGHQWASYKWARTSSNPPGPIEIKVRDNTRLVGGKDVWSAKFTRAMNDWNDPVGTTKAQASYPKEYLRTPATPLEWTETPPIKLMIQSKGSLDPKQCRPTLGYIEVCNYPYGKKGWSGIAQIWTSNGSISQASAKLNDTYLTESYYTNYKNMGFGGYQYASATDALNADRQLVLCQEVAHGFGMDHDDENFSDNNTGTCMDYGNSPMFDEHPRYADFAVLERMYCPVGDCPDLPTSTTTTTSPRDTASAGQEVGTVDPVPVGEEINNDPSFWGEVTEYDGKGRPSHYHKNLGNGKAVETFVIYARDVSADEVAPGNSDAGHSNGGTVDGGKPHDGGKKADNKRDDGKQTDGKKADSKRAKSKKQDGKKDEKRQSHHDKRRR